MVTAGVYLLLRSSPLLEYASTTLVIITWIGALTAFMAATIGLLQNDLKRVIAYSTCSQLGYMVIGCGLSHYSVSLFHLVNHAFFKALLFLSAGAVIHSVYGQQDIRKMGGLINLLPFTYTMMLIGSLSLMALPFLTGFYSKDFILEIAKGHYSIKGDIAYWFGTLSALFTSIYSLRLLTLTFLSYPNGSKSCYQSVHESSLIMTLPLIILALFSIFFGYITKDLFIGLGTSFWSNSLFTHPNNISYVEAEFGLIQTYKLLPLFGSIFGGLFTLFLYQNSPLLLLRIKSTKLGLRIYRFLIQRYYFDNIFSFLVQKGLTFGLSTSKVIDRGNLEKLGPYGLVEIFRNTSNKIASFDTGFIPHYALFIFIGFISMILISSNLFYIQAKEIILLIWIIFFFSVEQKKLYTHK